MDRYKKECEACWCKQAQAMRYHYDVWFNCNSCPYPECHEPETREQYLSDMTKREADYIRLEEVERLQRMQEDMYRQTKHFRSSASFATTIRKKVENKTLLSPREFAKALHFCRTKNADRLEFYRLTELIKHQLYLLGYANAAEEIVDYIEYAEGY